jgi:hypothetical protein
VPLPKKKSKKESNYLKKIYTIIGQPKIGKTTIASKLGGDEGDVLFFCTEPGHKFQEIYKWETKDGHSPTSWEHFKECVRELLSGEHNFKAICIDTVDNLYSWCSTHVLREQEIEHESDLGFGKGWKLVEKEFHTVINFITQKDYGVIFLTHEKTENRKKKGVEYNYSTSTLGTGATRVVHGLSDYIFYFHSDDDGRRWIRTKGTNNINAGDRSGLLPELIPMDAETLINELRKE